MASVTLSVSPAEKAEPKASMQPPSEGQQQGMGMGSSSLSPLHLWGVLGDTPFPSPACPFPAALQ